MIKNKFIHFKTYATFELQLLSGNISNDAIVLIKDTKQIYSHGQFYGNDVESFEQTASSDEDDGINTWTITYTNGDTIDISVKNGSQGSQGEQGIQGLQGLQGPAAVFDANTGNILATLEQTTGQSTVNAMTQKAVTDELDSIRKDAYEESFYEGIDIYPSSFSAKNYYISATTGLWVSNGAGSYTCFFMRVTPGAIYRFKRLGSQAMLCVFVTNTTTTNGEAPSYATGEEAAEAYKTMGGTDYYYKLAPDDAEYLYVRRKTNGNIVSMSIEKMVSVKEKIESIKEEQDTISQKVQEIDLLNYNQLIVEPIPITYVGSVYIRSGVWDTYSGSSGALMSVNPGDKVLMKNGNYVTYYTFLQDKSRTSGETPNWAEGYTGVVLLEANGTTIVTVPDNANYIYILYTSNNLTRKPTVLGVVKDINDAVTDLNRANDERKNIDWIAVNTKYTSNTQYIGSIPSQSTNKWVTSTVSGGRFIPVVEGEKIKVVCDIYDNATFGAFLTSRNHTENSQVQYCQNTKYIEFAQNKIYVLDVPSGAKYLYICTKRSNNLCSPHVYKLVSVNTQIKDMSLVGPYLRRVSFVEEYPDKTIDENGNLVDNPTTNLSVVRKYNINQGKLYYASLRYGTTQVNPVVAYYDSADNFLGEDNNLTCVESDRYFIQEKLTIPDLADYVLIKSSPITATSVGAFPPLLYEGTWTPKSEAGTTPMTIEYHVAKIDSTLLWSDTNEDLTQGETIRPVLVNSPWAIMWPNTYTPHGTPTRVIAMLHGSDGYVTSAVLGYPHANFQDWVHWRRKYLNEGWAVLDINGVGVSASADVNSRHYGCPAAIQTLDKAFEYLKEHYNVYDKMLIHGTSMGGCLALNYAKVHPEKVVAVGVFAPAITMRSITFNNPNHVSTLYGYPDKDESLSDNYENTAGWALFSKCLAWHEDPITNTKSLVEMPWSDIVTDIRENNDSADWKQLGEDKISEYQMIEKIDVPVRCWHGIDDDTVPVEYSKLMIAALRRGGTQATLRLVENAGHGISSGTNENVTTESVYYFNQYIYNE